MSSKKVNDVTDGTDRFIDWLHLRYSKGAINMYCMKEDNLVENQLILCSRNVMTPHLAKKFYQNLGKILENYEKKFGPIEVDETPSGILLN